MLGLERIFSRLRRIFGGEHLQYEEITKQRRHKLLWFLKQDVLSVKNILAQLKREESDSGRLRCLQLYDNKNNCILFFSRERHRHDDRESSAETERFQEKFIQSV